MQQQGLLVTLSLLLARASLVSSWTPAPTHGSDLLASQSLAKLKSALADGSLKQELAKEGVAQTCGPDNWAVRREYSTLSDEEKLEYTRAVKCLMAKPSTVDPEQVPGARSRYDDFVAAHINNTPYIHNSGYFLHWHRAFYWNFEQALRNECGYKGYLPYWNHGKSSHDLINSPYLDGSPTSQGGNGVYAKHGCAVGLPSRLLCIPAGAGVPLSLLPSLSTYPPKSPATNRSSHPSTGGCVETGPYAGLMMNISATVPTSEFVTAGPKFSYRPRCVRHDINNALGQKWAGDERAVELLTGAATGQAGIAEFDAGIENTGTDTEGFYGLHQYGHFAVSGDPSGDFYNSPNEPLFWLHHGQVDRLWWIWQNQKPAERALAIHGTRTMYNKPPSDDATLEDVLQMDKSGADVVFKDTVSSVGGKYCYVYE
ncbi:Tyrosinase-like protein [Apiospora saccharicola]|uniref:Tyrosinase-like protein n=1 Tax=Apiospora saccharicola TaxID=335842 RepID=A0ABR1WDT0_9PEZI